MTYESRKIARTDARQCRSHRELRRSERGSALLIVFLFSAIIAIMLYRELPVAAFEAERNREQLLIDRGNEYAHAVRLFVRKFRMYPASIAQLENTNRMRFLRHRFKDPLTGNDDWRLLHAGPNGQLLDSKVNPIGKLSSGTDSNSSAATAGSLGANASSGPFATNASPGTATSGSDSNSMSTPGQAVVPSVPQRPPAIAANGTGQATSASQGSQDPMTPLLPPSQTANGAENGRPATDVQQQAQATGQNVTQAADQTQGQGVAAQGSTQPAQGDNPPNGMNTVRALLNNPNPSQTNSSRLANITSGGGIAGVASKAEGHSIKAVNDQTQYPLWEFYYDPTKDAMGAMASAAQAGAAQSGAQIGGQNFGGGNSSGLSTPARNAPAAVETASPAAVETASPATVETPEPEEPQ
jgi:hypothetical protein